MYWFCQCNFWIVCGESLQENDRETVRHLRFRIDDCFIFVSLSHEAKELGRILLWIGEVKSEAEQVQSQGGWFLLRWRGGFGYFVDGWVKRVFQFYSGVRRNFVMVFDLFPKFVEVCCFVKNDSFVSFVCWNNNDWVVLFQGIYGHPILWRKVGFLRVYFNLALILEISLNIAFLRSVAVASSSLTFKI